MVPTIVATSTVCRLFCLFCCMLKPLTPLASIRLFIFLTDTCVPITKPRSSGLHRGILTFVTSGDFQFWVAQRCVAVVGFCWSDRLIGSRSFITLTGHNCCENLFRCGTVDVRHIAINCDLQLVGWSGGEDPCVR